MNLDTLNDIIELCTSGKMTTEHHSHRELAEAISDLASELGARATSEATVPTAFTQPIRLRICCEKCGTLHIDKGPWRLEPHKRHQCESCGLIWQPALYPTIGVQFLNEPEPPAT
jgi:hypothetical protein